MLRVRTEFGCGARKATIWVRSFFRNNPQIWLGAMQTTEPFTSLLRLPSIGCERKHEVSFPIYRSEPRSSAFEIRERAKLGTILSFCCEQILDPFAYQLAAPRLPPKPRRTILANAVKRNKKKQNEITLISATFVICYAAIKRGVR